MYSCGLYCHFPFVFGLAFVCLMFGSVVFLPVQHPPPMFRRKTNKVTNEADAGRKEGRKGENEVKKNNHNKRRKGRVRKKRSLNKNESHSNPHTYIIFKTSVSRYIYLLFCYRLDSHFFNNFGSLLFFVFYF